MKNLQHALAVIANDCVGRLYLLRDGKTCAVGALALAAGIPPQELRRIRSIHGKRCRTRSKVCWALKDTFDLSVNELGQIEAINDNFAVTEDRQQWVSLFLRECSGERFCWPTGEQSVKEAAQHGQSVDNRTPF